MLDRPAERSSAWLQHQPRHRPDIEGLRAIAVLAVVAFHAKIPGFQGGFIGVDVFFVLSGYLITWILVSEAERTGTIDLSRFYARRARRLLPAMAVVLLATLVATAFLYAPFEQRTLVRTWATTALYVSNLDFAEKSLDYHAALAQTHPLLHTWSLSVEEQFYLVWPWLVLAGVSALSVRGRRSDGGARRLLAVLGTTTALSFALSLYLTPTHGAWAFYIAPTRAWEFGAGALAVLIPVNLGQVFTRTRRLAAVAASWSAVFGLAAATTLYDDRTPFPGIAALLPVLATVVLLRAGSGENGASALPARLLALRPLQLIGRLSYSWYLWHWPVLVFASATAGDLGLGGVTAALALSLILALASYRLVEKPLRHHPVLTAKPARSFAMALGVSTVVVLLAVLWGPAVVSWSGSERQARFGRVARERPLIYSNDCDPYPAGDLVECVFGDSASPRTAILVGDSHASQFFPALHQAVDEAGWRLVVYTLSGCPFVDAPALFVEALSRLYPECVEWRRSAEAAIALANPEVTFVGSSNSHDVPVPAWEVGTRAIAGRLLLKSQRVVLILDPPSAGVDVPSCLARAAWRPGRLLDPDCKPRGSTPRALERVAAQERAARSIPGIEVLDVRDEVCVVGACEATSPEGLIRYRDTNHLSNEFARSFTPLFVSYLGRMDDVVVQ